MKRSLLHLISLLFLAGIIIYLSSCAPAYVPNTVNTPLLSNKGEAEIAVNYGLSGFDPQVAYAVTDHIGVMVNGSFRNSTSDSSDTYHKHNFIEGGAGYYTDFLGIGRFETYAGYGFGKLQALFDFIWDDYASVSCNRFFIQPGVGISTKVFDGSLASRFVIVNLHNASQSQMGYFLEPALTFKLGYKYVKGMMQFGFSYPLNNEGFDFDYQPFLFSIGIQASLMRNYED